MENASQALIIAGGILIAMLILSIGVFLFMSYNALGESFEQTMSATEIQKFNENFLKFEGRSDISIQEIVTLANFAKEYNEGKEDNEKVEVLIAEAFKVETSLEELEQPELTDMIKKDTQSDKQKKYTAQIGEYSRLVQKITFKETEAE